MWKVLVLFGILILVLGSGVSSYDVGEVLYLTPLLEEGRVERARELSRVKPDIGNTTSYSGFFTVDKDCEGNLFFWFFPAQKNWEQAPVILWLQGGPGQSSLYGLFEEVGPIRVGEEELKSRNHSWNVNNNLLFIDQPIGTGFSFSGKGCFASNLTEIGIELYSAVVQFFQLFPELSGNKFYVAGESYAGHYIPTLGHRIHINNPTASIKINLSGMMIGNGFMDAFYQLNIGDHLFHIGLIDERGRDVLNEHSNMLVDLLKEGEFTLAFHKRTHILDKLYNYYAGNISIYNYLKPDKFHFGTYSEFVDMPWTRKALHVGKEIYLGLNMDIIEQLMEDVMVSMKPLIEELLDHYVMVFYTGQLDIICGYPGTMSFLKELNWKGRADYENATRHPWCVGERPAGFFKGAHNLYDVLLLNAGHSAPMDQPQWAFELVNSVTSGPPDDPLHKLGVCPDTSNMTDQLFEKEAEKELEAEVGEPLFLTPLLEENNIGKARELSKVPNPFPNYSGFFTVNKQCESNLFFMLCGAQKNWETAPIVLWLTGGPGTAFLPNMFGGFGPRNSSGQRNNYSWNINNNLLFIDQPVGTGFSFSGKGCYAENMTVVGTDLYSALIQFFQLFPELSGNKFYIAGASFAGHFIPALGHTIHTNNPTASVKINLSGMMIGNGFMDALYQSDMGSYLYQRGLLDDEGKQAFDNNYKTFTEQMKNEKWLDAYYTIRGDLFFTYDEYVGNVSFSNYLKSQVKNNQNLMDGMEQWYIRKVIHVGMTNYSLSNEEVENHLTQEIVRSVKPWIEELLESYPIVFYNGQLDILCNYPGMMNFLKALDWNGRDDFKNAKRHKWCVGETQAGYFKGAHNLYAVLVRNAGHAVHVDQPAWAYELVNSVTSSHPENPLNALNICGLEKIENTTESIKNPNLQSNNSNSGKPSSNNDKLDELEDLNLANSTTTEEQNEIGECLFLSPLLEEKKIEEAKELSRVKPDIGNMTSYSGFFTVNKACESNLFFWFFPAQKDWEKAPLVLWLEGGPGESSLLGLFRGVGPLSYKEKLESRNYSWNVNNNVLFIDQPVGTGFSFTNKSCYAENMTAVGTDLYSAVVQFLQLFPELSNNKFFITGVSFAGHFVPALGHTIHKNNPTADVKINLSGMMIGNGWLDAMYQNDISSYLYHIGLIDHKTINHFHSLFEQFSQFMNNQNYTKAYTTEVDLVSLYNQKVGLVSAYKYLGSDLDDSWAYMDFILKPQTRQALHVGKLKYFGNSELVQGHLTVADVLSVKALVEELLENYVIVFYNGQLDVICNHLSIRKFLNELKWSGSSDFNNATRHHWCVDYVQAGYFRSAHNLHEVLVRNAGHAVHEDQPQWAFELVNSVTSSPPHNALHTLKPCNSDYTLNEV